MDHSLTQSPAPLSVDKVRANAYKAIPLRWRNILYLHLSGKSAKEIAFRTGYSLNSIYRILSLDEIEILRGKMLQHTQKEFDALYEEVTEAIRNGLKDPDPKVQAIFTGQWLKARGKVKEDVNTNVTAENVVMNILNGDVNAQ